MIEISEFIKTTTEECEFKELRTINLTKDSLISRVASFQILNFSKSI